MAKARCRIWKFSRGKILAAAKYHGVTAEYVPGFIWYDRWVFSANKDSEMVSFLDEIHPNWRRNYNKK